MGKILPWLLMLSAISGHSLANVSAGQAQTHPLSIAAQQTNSAAHRLLRNQQESVAIVQSDTPRSKAEADVDIPTKLNRTVAKTLLAQIWAAANGIQEKEQQVLVLLELAKSYRELFEEATAAELLYEALATADKTAEKRWVSQIIRQAGFLSDDAVVYDLFSQALDLVSTMEDTSSKAYLLSEIALYIDAFFADPSTVNAFNNRVIRIADEMSAGGAKFETLWLLTYGYQNRLDVDAIANLLAQSIDALSTVEDPEAQLLAIFGLRDLIENLPDEAIGERLLEQFVGLANTMPDDVSKAYVWTNSILLAERIRDTPRVETLLQQSLAVANSADNDSARANVLFSIADSYGRLANHQPFQDFPPQLFQAVEQIEESVSYHETLVTVAKAAAASAKKTQSSDNLAQMIEFANTLGNGWTKAHGLIVAAGGYAQLSEQERAETLLEQALAAINIGQYSYSHKQVFIEFIAVSKTLPKESRQQLLTHYLSVINQIEDKIDLSYLLSAMADDYGAGYETSTNTLIENLLLVVKDIPDTKSRAQGLHRALQSLIYLSLDKDAVVDGPRTHAMLQQVLAYTDGLEKSIADTGFWNSFAQATIKLENKEHIYTLLTQLVALSTKSDSPSFGANVSLAIAQLYVSLADEAAAKAWLEKAFIAGRQIEHEGGKIATMADMVEIIHLLSDGTAVEAWLDRWLELTKAMEQSHMQGSGLNIIADASGRLSDQARVRSLVEEIIAIASAINNDTYRANALGSMAEALATMAAADTSN